MKEFLKKNKTKLVIIIALLIIIPMATFIILLLSGRISLPNNGTPTKEINGQTVEFEKDDSGKPIETFENTKDTFDVPVFSDMTLSKTNAKLKLTNPEGNTVYLKFVFKNAANDILYETKYVSPGTNFNVDLLQFCIIGRQDINIEVCGYTPDTLEATGCSANNPIVLIIK